MDLPGEKLVHEKLVRDRFGRVFDYLRIAVVERCNLRCVYCMPEDGVAFHDRDALLSDDEILRVVTIGARLGVDRLRFTGGEPLLRPGLTELVQRAVAVDGIRSAHLTTNGMLLARHAVALRDAGLSGVNISLDTLDPKRFVELTRRGELKVVLGAVYCAVETGFESVKINVVALRGLNDDQLPAFVELTRDLPVTVRFIELMPFDADQVWKRGNFLGVHKIKEALDAAYPELETAPGSATEGQTYQVAGYAGRIALIPAFSRTMCAGCNRIRLTADGQLRNCLFSEREFDVRGLLRGGASDAEIGEAVRGAMAQKLVDGWEAQRQAKEDRQNGPKRPSMTLIGG